MIFTFDFEIHLSFFGRRYFEVRTDLPAWEKYLLAAQQKLWCWVGISWHTRSDGVSGRFSRDTHAKQTLKLMAVRKLVLP